MKSAEDAAAKLFAVDRKRVREWCQNKEKLEALLASSSVKKKNKRLPGGGRQVRYKDIEEELLAWFDDRCEAGVRVTGKSLKTEALRLHKLKGNQNFKASQGWYSSFIKCNKISMRRSTHIAQHSREITDNSFRENVIVTCKSVVGFFSFSSSSCLEIKFQNGIHLKKKKLFLT